MVYAKIKEDGAIRNRFDYLPLVKDELLTKKELEKLQKEFHVDKSMYDLIEIPKSRTGWFFGARFELKGGET